ncbi:uncharacterized protein BT62DRAFT_157211 [Guyanagaster necrorhizus]|uniref:Uncharacterized protein n=1 Tax=Guyanagaster necrorhizus TaxID=856835 RepID=A0A9P7VRM7_9AGAR|nr:uncharacterized protein BT62DRAFT_157211 [Guyanagaster necrorhizus MCA 3950]KAG7446176.1 hypothetical protein BT62DRAFT_157211 [Guyanagaster necrorhizus MCA 3950]
MSRMCGLQFPVAKAKPMRLSLLSGIRLIVAGCRTDGVQAGFQSFWSSDTLPRPLKKKYMGEILKIVHVSARYSNLPALEMKWTVAFDYFAGTWTVCLLHSSGRKLPFRQ